MKTLSEYGIISYATERWLIVLTVMLAAILEVLDSVIVSVSMPAMMGELGASSDQITWVLTSYIVASAVVMLLTGFLDARLGRKNLLLLSMLGFTVSSALCGLSTNLQELLVFRICQGAFGATLIPLSQSILQNIFSPQERSRAMAIWGIGIMTAPMLGPTLGGYIMDNANWRWIFYINIPVCLISLTLGLLTIKNTAKRFVALDWLGLLLMIAGVGCLQLVLDQGSQKNWFASNLITALTFFSLLSLAAFLMRGIRNPHNIINLQLFKDRYFTLATVLLLLYAGALFSTLVIQPLLLEHLMGYPAVEAGKIMAPRGLASAVAMGLAVNLMKRFGAKPLLYVGILLTAYGTFSMSHYSLQASPATFIWPGVFQGLGMGLFFVPLSTVSLLTIPPAQIAEASGIFSYGRMLGTSIGISVLSTIITRQTQVNWNQLGEHLQPFNANLHTWLTSQNLMLHNPLAIQRMAYELARQANMVAYIDGFWLLSLIILALLPLVFCFGKIDLSKLQEQLDKGIH